MKIQYKNTKDIARRAVSALLAVVILVLNNWVFNVNASNVVVTGEQLFITAGSGGSGGPFNMDSDGFSGRIQLRIGGHEIPSTGIDGTFTKGADWNDNIGGDGESTDAVVNGDLTITGSIIINGGFGGLNNGYTGGAAGEASLTVNGRLTVREIVVHNTGTIPANPDRVADGKGSLTVDTLVVSPVSAHYSGVSLSGNGTVNITNFEFDMKFGKPQTYFQPNPTPLFSYNNDEMTFQNPSLDNISFVNVNSSDFELDDEFYLIMSPISAFGPVLPDKTVPIGDNLYFHIFWEGNNLKAKVVAHTCDKHVCNDCTPPRVCTLHVCAICNVTCDLHVCNDCTPPRVCTLHVCAICNVTCDLHVCNECIPARTCTLHVCVLCSRVCVDSACVICNFNLGPTPNPDPAPDEMNVINNEDGNGDVGVDGVDTTLGSGSVVTDSSGNSLTIEDLSNLTLFIAQSSGELQSLMDSLSGEGAESVINQFNALMEALENDELDTENALIFGFDITLDYGGVDVIDLGEEGISITFAIAEELRQEGMRILFFGIHINENGEYEFILISEDLVVDENGNVTVILSKFSEYFLMATPKVTARIQTADEGESTPPPPTPIPNQPSTPPPPPPPPPLPPPVNTGNLPTVDSGGTPSRVQTSPNTSPPNTNHPESTAPEPIEVPGVPDENQETHELPEPEPIDVPDGEPVLVPTSPEIPPTYPADAEPGGTNVVLITILSALGALVIAGVVILAVRKTKRI
ncbi:MAG: hypothetical protein LBC82_03880 [Oscillospiraceae bacterium]|nr:hypothetical protein [Oscillospiraceae bacterium]